MTAALIKYETACRALAECKAVDEVKAWADKAAAMQAYGRMAQDKTLEIDAAEIRLRAERRLGELLAGEKAAGGLATGSRGQLAGKTEDGQAVVRNDRQRKPRLAVVGEDRQIPAPVVPTLAQVGISKDLSSRAQKLAAVPAEQFEAEVGEWRERVSAEGARVSARLEKAGAKAIKDRPPAEDFGPSEAELASSARLQQEEIESLRLIAAADDKLAASLAENHKLRSMNRVLQERNDGLMNEKAELLKRYTALQRKVDKLERGA